MNDIHKRLVLFLIGCMGARSGLTYIIKHHTIQYKLFLVVLLMIPAIGFSYIYLNDLRKTGGEVFGGKIWWNNLRPFHAIMYFTSAVMVYIQNKKAYYVVGLDTLVGLISFILFHTGYIM